MPRLKVTEQVQVQYTVDIDKPLEEIDSNIIAAHQPPREEWIEMVYEREWKEEAPDVLDYWEDEHPDFPYEDWKYEVANGDTRLGYWDWARNQEESV